MFEGRLNKIIIFLIYVSIFVNSYVFAKEPAEIYLGYVIFFLLLPIFVLRHPIPGYFVVIFLVLFLAGVVSIMNGGNTAPQFFKVFLGVFMSYLFYYYVLIQFEFNVEKLFDLYLKGCFVVSVIGLVQLVSFQLKFTPGYDFSWILNKWGVVKGGNFGIRINSIFGEPTYFGACVSAGAFVSMYNLVVKKPYFLSRFQSFVIFFTYVSTFSGLAYFALFIAILILLINFGFFRYVLIFVPILLGMFVYLYNNVPDFHERFESTVNIFLTGRFTIGKTHGSSIVLYNNYRIALENFSTNFLVGTGLGSHPVAFEKFSITKNIVQGGFSLNNQDANSMLLRLISETGLFGTVLMLGIAFKNFVRRNANTHTPEHFWLISGAILTMMMANFLRQGHYFLNGFPFFVWLYYYNHVNYKKYLSLESAKQEMDKPQAESPVVS